ncbi:MAG: Fpg/Nei family DNA glycosylase [Actinobacteria bacterium]|uniref:DNA-(apurinic or apyrimidinic site) lyase n=1 Tax=freshwater metagenome TaxID=449393 RepID=A0A6J7LSL9_9ZZZZ|nr:Fpg/Nei family DNA glycosylase [Actinomycetota bacterium]
MPEGHVVHSQARALKRAFAGGPVAVDSPQGRFDEGAALLDGATMTTTQAYGKHLFLGFAAHRWVHVHLGLFGKWRIAKGEAPAARGLIRLRLVNDTHHAELRGPTVCEVLTDDERAAAVSRIGPDPIRPDADPLRAWEKVTRSRVAIGALLMDQRLFAGVGNIYRAEVLFRHGISPFRPGVQVSWADFDAIWTDLTVLMADGVRRRRIDTVRPEHMPEIMGRLARRDRHGGEVYVYRRAGLPCYLCGDEVRVTDMQARNLYWCATCQLG